MYIFTFIYNPYTLFYPFQITFLVDPFYSFIVFFTLPSNQYVFTNHLIKTKSKIVK